MVIVAGLVAPLFGYAWLPLTTPAGFGDVTGVAARLRVNSPGRGKSMAVPTEGNGRMLWVAICSHCGEKVAMAPRIGDEEAALMNAHLRVSHPEHLDASAPRDLSFGAVLRHFRMEPRF